MKSTIIDSGPIIALFDKDDRCHQKTLEFMHSFDGKLILTWAVIREVTHMLSFNLAAQLNFLKWVEMEAITIYQI